MADINGRGVPVTMGPQGFWLDAQGNVAATDPSGKPQVTPGDRDNPTLARQYDAGKDLYYTVDAQGNKLYLSPASSANHAGAGTSGQGTGHGMMETMNKGGGAFMGSPTWNQAEGKFDVKVDWGKMWAYVAASVITYGQISQYMSTVSLQSAPAAIKKGAEVAGAKILHHLLDNGEGDDNGNPTDNPGGSGDPDEGGDPSNTDPDDGGYTGGDPGGSGGGGGGGGGGTDTRTTQQKIHDIIAAGGSALGAAGNAAAENRHKTNEETNLAQRTNIYGQSEYQLALDARSKLEADQRKDDQLNLARASYAQNRRPGPYNAGGLTPQSDAYLSTMSELEKQAAARLGTAPQYSTNAMPALAPYQDYHPDTKQSAIEQIANYGVPAAKIATSIWQPDKIVAGAKTAKSVWDLIKDWF